MNTEQTRLDETPRGQGEHRGQGRESQANKAKRLKQLIDEDYDASGSSERRNPLGSGIWLFILWCVVLMLGSIGWGFHLNMLENKVNKKERFLTTLKYRHLYIEADLIEHERFDAIQHRAQTFRLGLELSSVPPYEVAVPR